MSCYNTNNYANNSSSYQSANKEYSPSQSNILPFNSLSSGYDSGSKNPLPLYGSSSTSSNSLSNLVSSYTATSVSSGSGVPNYSFTNTSNFSNKDVVYSFMKSEGVDNYSLSLSTLDKSIKKNEQKPLHELFSNFVKKK